MTAKSLRVSGLSKNYGGVAALKNVELSVEPGEVHGIIGPNGAGKSTLVDIITGFTSASGGTVEMDGQPLPGQPFRLARAGVSRTFQHTSLFAEETVRGNLEIAVSCMRVPFGRSWRGGSVDIDGVLESVGLAAFAGNPADSLSYGAQRKLAIGVALMADPDMLLLDEPAAGMNPVESQSFVELVQQLRVDRTVVLIEHDMTVIRALCDRSTVLVDGEVLTSGRTADVLDDQRVIDVYLGGSNE